MLPTHAARQRRKIRLDASPKTQLLDSLTRRSRITNLGVLLISALAALSLIYNIHLWLRLASQELYGLQQQPTLFSVLATIARPPIRKTLNHLVIVPCHSIWTGHDSWNREEDWMLESYQTGSARVHAFVQHITKSAELHAKDPNSLLVFSGGQTKLATTTTEAESYLRLAHKAQLVDTFGRATTENYALDSFQNLLFSIARFREFTGHYPERITVVGYDFKRPRFTQLHRAALRWPIEKFTYIGVDPDDHDRGSIEGERTNGYVPYTSDTYGCHSLLLSKRRQRNPHARFHPYILSSPELSSLFSWCPDMNRERETHLFTGKLPWDNTLSFVRDT